MLVSKILETKPKTGVVSVHPHSLVGDAAKLLADKGIGTVVSGPECQRSDDRQDHHMQSCGPSRRCLDHDDRGPVPPHACDGGWRDDRVDLDR